MTDRIETTLAQYSTDWRLRTELHAVPPYRVVRIHADGRDAVLKIDAHPRGHAADEGRVQAYVANHTSVSVPEVLAVGDDHYITAWHDSFAGDSPSVDRQWARAAGGWLGTLHEETAGTFEQYGMPRDDGGRLGVAGHDEWADAIVDRVQYHRPFLADHGYADVVDAVVECLRRNRDQLRAASPPVCCHGDVHPEHHVRDEQAGVLGIDFEHALVAPAAYDYWRTIMPYFEASDDVAPAVTDAFREGYTAVRELPTNLAAQRPYYVLLNTVAFLESLFLQQNAPPERREKMGAWLERRALERVRELTV